MTDEATKPEASMSGRGDRSADEERALIEASGSPSDRQRNRFGAGMAMPTERSANFGSTLRRLAGLLRPERPSLIAVAALVLIGVTLSVLGPRLLGEATDIVVTGFLDGNVDVERLRTVLLTVLGLYIGSWILGVVQAYLVAGVVQHTMFRLREAVEAKINRLPLSYVDRQPRGELLSRVTNDIDNLAQGLQQSMSQIFTSLLTLVGVIVMMFVISPLLATVALITVPVSLWAMKYIGSRARPRYFAQWSETGAVNAQVEETFTGHAIVRAFGRDAEAQREFSESNERLYESSFAAQFLASTIQPITMFAGNVQYLLLAVVGGLRIASGAVSVGEVQAIIQYSRQFSQPLSHLASMATVFQSGMASLERVLDLLDAPEVAPDFSPAQHLGPVRGEIVFDDVVFSYDPDPSSEPLIGGLSFVAEPGQTIAIVGPTGAGKTTVVNLLMRFYELRSGQIRLDGVDVAEVPRSELRSKVGMVLQDTWLFEGSIRDNLAYGNPDASEDEIMAAAQMAYVDRFVHALPDGYDTLVDDEGTNISAGEKQLITIARAFLANPSVLVLDEATSSVDTRTEVLIQEALDRLRHDRTSFVIAHRLSTIRNADTILVMDGGDIVEQGDHDALIEVGGRYAELYQAQFSSAIVEHQSPDFVS